VCAGKTEGFSDDKIYVEENVEVIINTGEITIEEGNEE